MKTILMLLLLACGLNTQAQILSKQLFTSGTGFFRYQDEYQLIQVEVQPTFGYVFRDNLVAGLTSYYYRDAIKNNSSYRIIGIGPMVRYFINDSKLRLFPHLEVTYNFYKSKSTSRFSPAESTEEMASAYGALGAAYFFHENAAVELMAGFQVKDPTIFDKDALRVRFGFSVFFGGQ